MAGYLETLAFALVIGGQFLAAVVLISKRDSVYRDMRQPQLDRDQPHLGQRSQHGLDSLRRVRLTLDLADAKQKGCPGHSGTGSTGPRLN
jgi:hypothetical protein